MNQTISTIWSHEGPLAVCAHDAQVGNGPFSLAQSRVSAAGGDSPLAQGPVRTSERKCEAPLI